MQLLSASFFSKGPLSQVKRLTFAPVQAIEGHLAQQVATAVANLDHLKEHKHLILKSQGGSHLQGAGSPLTARHNKVGSHISNFQYSHARMNCSCQKGRV